MCCIRSAGVGRTGVFIALSIVLERMRYEGVVDLFQTVKLLRTQRQGMIQSEVQYTHHDTCMIQSVYFALLCGTSKDRRLQSNPIHAVQRLQDYKIETIHSAASYAKKLCFALLAVCLQSLRPTRDVPRHRRSQDFRCAG